MHWRMMSTVTTATLQFAGSNKRSFATCLQAHVAGI